MKNDDKQVSDEPVDNPTVYNFDTTGEDDSESKGVKPHIDNVLLSPVASVVKSIFPSAQDLGVIVPSENIIDFDYLDDNFIPPASSIEQEKQTKLLERLAAERDPDTQKLLRPKYNAAKRQLIFGNTIIDIPVGEQQLICKALFRGGKPVSHPIDIGDMLLKMGVPLDQVKNNKRVYYAKSNLNTTVAKNVHVKDLFVINNKKIGLNQKYL